MVKYEGVVALRPTLKEADLGKVTSEIEESITANGGEILESEAWGRRRLAYEIKGAREAHYHRISFRIAPESVVRLKGIFKMKEDILRDMITRQPERS